MAETQAPTILCLTSYDKGERFMRECSAQGCRVLLLTLTELQHIAWPRECLEEIYFMPDLTDIPAVIDGISYVARGKRIDRIVPLDEYDMMLAATLREHFRLPGMGETATRLGLGLRASLLVLGLVLVVMVVLVVVVLAHGGAV